jgi:hypothetical protein
MSLSSLKIMKKSPITVYSDSYSNLQLTHHDLEITPNFSASLQPLPFTTI